MQACTLLELPPELKDTPEPFTDAEQRKVKAAYRKLGEGGTRVGRDILVKVDTLMNVGCGLCCCVRLAFPSKIKIYNTHARLPHNYALPPETKAEKKIGPIFVGRRVAPIHNAHNYKAQH